MKGKKHRRNSGGATAPTPGGGGWWRFPVHAERTLRSGSCCRGGARCGYSCTQASSIPFRPYLVIVMSVGSSPAASQVICSKPGPVFERARPVTVPRGVGVGSCGGSRTGSDVGVGVDCWFWPHAGNPRPMARSKGSARAVLVLVARLRLERKVAVQLRCPCFRAR